MVKLNKTPLREGLTIKSEKDYQDGEIFKLLMDDCYHKCYICEQRPRSPEVEHRIAHRGDIKLIFDWNNIFYACRHCNKIKNQKRFYGGIINPLVTDPEECIELRMSYDNLREKVVLVKKVKDDALVDVTVDLLDLVHNNVSTDNSRESACNLRKKISDNLSVFLMYIKHYKEEQSIGDYYNIIEEISIDSEFAAFKRQMIKDDPGLLAVFSKNLEGAIK